VPLAIAEEAFDCGRRSADRVSLLTRRSRPRMRVPIRGQYVVSTAPDRAIQIWHAGCC